MSLPSLLLEDAKPPTEGQPLLFSLPEDVQDALERDGRYTGERLFLRKPELYRAVVQLLKEGQSIRAIKRACAVHHSTIAAVAARERIVIDTGKEKIVGELGVLRSLLVESLTDAVVEGKVKPEALPIALGVVIDKMELLNGGATVRVETVEREGAPKTWEQWRQATLKQAKGREIGLGGGENGQMALGAGAAALGSGAIGDQAELAGAGGSVAVHRLELARTDEESAGTQRISGGATAGATAGDGDGGARLADPAGERDRPAAGEQGGEGVRREAGGALGGIGQAT